MTAEVTDTACERWRESAGVGRQGAKGGQLAVVNLEEVSSRVPV